jgi:hypothetical protein
MQATWAETTIVGDEDCSARDDVLRWCGAIPWATWGNWRTPAPAEFKGKIVWNKGPAFGMGDLAFPWKPSFEECWFSRGPWRADKRGEGVWSGPIQVSWQTVAGGRMHPNQKPVWLFHRIVSALPSGFTILDPFMGSGTTGVACVQTGRRFVGVEISEEYFTVAKDRIKRELDLKNGSGPMFRQEPEVLFRSTVVPK